MGWTEYRATHYNKYGIDRRAECRAYFERNEKWGTLLKDAMVGSTWYGAVKLTETGEVFAAVFLTSTRDGTEFAYKDMSDSMGPCQYDCPESILKLLSPTDNKFALEWREKCRQRQELKKKLNKAKVIELTYGYDTKYNKAGDTIRLEKLHYRKQWWNPFNCYIVPTRMVLENQFKIIA